MKLKFWKKHRKPVAMIPILVKHDRANVIGFLCAREGKLHFEFNREQRITLDGLFKIVGNVGVAITEQVVDDDGQTYVFAGLIHEFSLSL